MPTDSAKQLREIIAGQSPTDEQGAAIFAEEREFLLRASPGSGKTWTSCRRYLWRVENWNDGDGGLALLSFTNTAIKEFEAATVSAGRRAGLCDPHFVGTFDSFVERFIITPFGHLVCGTKKRPKLHLSPRPGDRKNPKLVVWVDSNNGRKFPVPAWEIMPYAKDGKIGCKWMLNGGNTILDTSRGIQAMKALLEYGFYTHSHRNFWACHLLDETPRLAEIIARRFPELIVDEAQDTGFWLLYLLQQLRKAGAKITLIGDPDQCIYEFSMASANSLQQLKDEWKLVERPLNKSFRCNNDIAGAVRQISGNLAFEGCGAARNEHAKAYIVSDASEGFVNALAAFRDKAANVGITDDNCAILCRGHEQVARIRGTVRYLELQGKTKQMAMAAFLRDKKGDFKRAFEITVSVLRELTDAPEVWDVFDEQPESEAAFNIRLGIWQFIRSSDGLPSISLNGKDWIDMLKVRMSKLLTVIGVKNPPSLGMQFQRRGLKDNQMEFPLFDEQALFPAIRYETIHKVKGESIDGVLVVGSKKFFDALAKDVTEGKESEDRRLGYVAMTRAKHLLMIALHPNHLKTYATFWADRGFEVM